MKKNFLSFSLLLLFSSCNNGRYQLHESKGSTLILDTKTGDLYRHLYEYDEDEWRYDDGEWIKITGPINGTTVTYL